VQLIITILSGVRAGHRIVLSPGDRLKFGRTAKAEIVVADDPTMSSLHCEVQCEQDGCRVRDLNSRNGLFVNNDQVAEAELRDGDRLRAGRTFFGVAIEQVDEPLADHETAIVRGSIDDTMRDSPGGIPRPPTHADVDSTLRTATVVFPLKGDPPAIGATVRYLPGDQSHLSMVWPAGAGRLYAVVDGAVAFALVEQARRLGLRTESLLAGQRSPYLAAVVPYLIEIAPQSGFLDLWYGYLKKSPGVLLEAMLDFAPLLEHVRRLFVARDVDGKESFFRFYDPRVLENWLPTRTSNELAEFFGGVTGIVIGVDGGNRLARLSRTEEQVASEEVVFK
jgi:hypothetical protein